jgi:hypothetical protein
MADKVEKRLGRKRRRREKGNGVGIRTKRKRKGGTKMLKKSAIFISCSVPGLPQYLSGDKIEKNKMDGACSAYGGEDRRIQGFGGET